MHHPFPGEAELISTIDAAVELGEPHAITGALSRSLSRLIAEQRVQLPAAVFEADEAHYARRLLHLSARHGYSVIAMTWAPGQGTLIHDHAGLWCVEGVWAGALEVTPYDLLETAGDEARFRAQATLHAGRGSCGSLIPPFEYHTIRNADAREVAVSVHVYSQAMNRCTVFEPLRGEWHRRLERVLQAKAGVGTGPPPRNQAFSRAQRRVLGRAGACGIAAAHEQHRGHAERQRHGDEDPQPRDAVVLRLVRHLLRRCRDSLAAKGLKPPWPGSLRRGAEVGGVLAAATPLQRGRRHDGGRAAIGVGHEVVADPFGAQVVLVTGIVERIRG